MTHCPYCKGESGFYKKERAVVKYMKRYEWNGDPGDNSDTYDHIDVRYISKRRYCLDCHKVVPEKTIEKYFLRL